MIEDNIHKDNQESYCADSKECVCGKGKKRAVRAGELCSLERKKKTGWRWESKEWRSSSERMSCGEKGDKKTGAKGVSMGENQSKKDGTTGEDK